jgi:hypothetical protein
MPASPNITGTADWPEANSSTYGPVKPFSVPQDRHQPRLPYRRVSEMQTSPLLASKPRVIIAHNGKSFAAPPL